MTTLHTYADFLAAIIAKPHDDAPRLVYCDFLDEQGDCDRAEFIKVQIELATLENCGAEPGHYHQSHCMRCYLRRRESALLAAHGKQWLCGEKCTECDGSSYEYHDNGGNVGQRNYCTGCNSTKTIFGGKGTGRIGGYPDAVQIFAGVECDSCLGAGWRYKLRGGIEIPETETCPDCHGLGRQHAFHRGFPSRFSCTMAEWCGSTAYIEGHINRYGHGHDIVKAAPCVAVDWTDKEPYVGEQNTFGWLRERNQEYVRNYQLRTVINEDVWNAMTGWQAKDKNFKWFPSSAAALSALSQAEILWAKSTSQSGKSPNLTI